MSESTIFVHENKKKRGPGRPRNPDMGAAVSARFPPDILARIKQWAADNGLTRSEAIVHLVTRALRREVGQRNASKKR
jgi:hypothetical protein